MQIRDCRGSRQRKGGKTRRNTEEFEGSETIILTDTVMVGKMLIHLSKPMECTTERMDPDVNYRL